MKKIHLTLLISLFTFSATFAQKGKSVTIFGDSYSTFEGFITPATNATWYFLDRPIKDNDVTAVEQTASYEGKQHSSRKHCAYGCLKVQFVIDSPIHATIISHEESPTSVL